MNLGNINGPEKRSAASNIERSVLSHEIRNPHALTCTNHKQDLTTSGLPEHVQEYMRCLLIARGADQAFRTKKELVNFKKVMLHLQNMFETAEADLSVFCAMQYIPHEPETADTRTGESVAATQDSLCGETVGEKKTHDACGETDAARRAVGASEAGKASGQIHTATGEATSRRGNVRDATDETSMADKMPLARRTQEEKAARKKRLQMLKDLDECRGMLHVLYVKPPSPSPSPSPWSPLFARARIIVLNFCSRALHTFSSHVFMVALQTASMPCVQPRVRRDTAVSRLEYQ